MSIANFIKVMLKEKAVINLQGNTIHSKFMSAERYIIDAAEDFARQGWIQYDTDQDAHYFGVWANPSKLMTLTYAEGDWSLVVCKDQKLYNVHIDSMNTCYGKGFIAKTIAANGEMTVYRQDRNECRAEVSP